MMSEKPTFGIGDKVWMSNYQRNRHKIECPDCSGTRTIGVVLANGEQYSIPCQGCASGYDPPTGYIDEYVFETQARSYTVTGVRTSSHAPVEYELDRVDGGCYIGRPDTVFATEAEAWAQGEVLKQEEEDEENKRLHSKLKDHRSWAWHVTYYRRELKRAKRDVERYEKGLGIAKEKEA